jgi:hypothetical protein
MLVIERVILGNIESDPNGDNAMGPRHLLPILIAALLAVPLRPASAQTPCPVSPHVVRYPATGPRGNNDWYANADRTIWALFGWDFIDRGPKEPYPRAGYIATPKVLWYKPSEYPLTVTGRRIDGGAPPLLYDIGTDPRPRGPIQPSRIDFPTTGCWELDAKAGSSELRFVVLVKEDTQ